MEKAAKFSIEDFLKTSALAQVVIVGGGARPFYAASLRSFAFEGNKTGQVVEDAFGLRSMLVDAEPRRIKAVGMEDKTQDEKDVAHILAPALLRIHARPRPYIGVQGHTLSMYAPQPRSGLLSEREVASDLLVTPMLPCPDQESSQIATIPPLRLVEGRYEVEIQLTDEKNKLNELGKLLAFDKSSLFGGLEIQVSGDKPKTLKVTLVPEGIEFGGSLPDPTRDFQGADPNGKVTAVFRIECDISPLGAPAYFLRLVRPVGNEPAIDAIEARIAAAFAGLGPDGAPVSVRYDKRPEVPPLLWPLVIKSNKLQLLPTGTDFETWIDRSAIDVRIKTQGHFRDQEQGLARIFADRIIWRRQKSGLTEVQVQAGTIAPSADDLETEFSRIDNLGSRWPGKVTKFGSRPFTAPLQPIADRLLPLYRAARALDETIRHAPYFFIPVQDGIVQIALPAPPSVNTVPSGRTETPDAQFRTTASPQKVEASNNASLVVSAMSGRVYVAQSGDSMRGLVLDDAAGIDLTIVWKKAKSDSVLLKAAMPKGQLVGFLFAAETSPTSREALPSLRSGPAATRDLPLWFGTEAPSPFLRGSASWTASNGKFEAEIEPGVTPPSQATDPKVIAWLPPGVSPFVTNHPLTRSQPSAPDPSLSRGLLPREVTKVFKLSFTDETGYLPAFSGGGQKWLQRFENTAQTFRDDTLVLTTLAGTEFVPTKDPQKFSLEGVLRFDLPILDELFAWSDPPKRTQPPSASGETGMEVTSLPTALEPGRLSKVWEANRRRMALTRTQSAHVTGWLSEGTSAKVKIAGLVETYGWTTDVELHAATPDAYGYFKLGLREFRLDDAVVGLGGGRGPNRPVAFKVSDKDDSLVEGNSDLVVAGYAANLYSHDGKSWDSRGFGVAPEAMGGSREAKLRRWNNPPKVFSLLTMQRAETIDLNTRKDAWGFQAPLQFFARDLPVDDSVFEGIKDATEIQDGTPVGGNPVEAAVGTQGQAFDQSDFAESLHEWRLFESVRQAQGTMSRRHDIRWGPFAFKPLRLRRAEFDKHGVRLIKVIGLMRLDRPLTATKEPFGPDDVYARGNLVQLALERDSGVWTYKWSGVEIQERMEGRIVLADRAPEVSFEVTLTDPNTPAPNIPATYRFKKPVVATVIVDLASRKKATFRLRLFGSDYLLENEIAPTSDGFTADIKAKTAGKLEGSHVVFSPSLSFTITGSSSTLAISGPISVLPKDRSRRTALCEFATQSFAWLDLPSTAATENLAIDHRTGLIHGEKRLVYDAGASPIFSLASQGKLHVAAAIAAVCPAGKLAKGKLEIEELSEIEMASTWMRVAATDETRPANRIDHQLVTSAAGRDHTLLLSWSHGFESLIRWPIGQIGDAQGNSLDPSWLDPSNADHTQRSRIIKIAGDETRRYRHAVTLHFNRHPIPADKLRKGTSTTVSDTVRLLAVTKHTLGDSKGVAKAHWTTTDHIAITTPSLMADEVKRFSFAPRFRTGTYRTENTADGHPGIIRLNLAAAGFHDKLFADKLWDKSDKPVILGGAATMFPAPDYQRRQPALPRRDFAAVIPWILLKNASPLNMAAGMWRVAAPDLWAAAPMQLSTTMSGVVVGQDFPSAAIVAQLGEGRFTRSASDARAVEAIIPIEQTFFEKWVPKQGNKPAKPAKMEMADFAGAPFFLRAMMAIEARLKEDKNQPPADGFDWGAESVQAARLTEANAWMPSVAALRVQVRTSEMRALFGPLLSSNSIATKPDTMVSLTALSQGLTTRQSDYRRMGGEVVDMAPSEIIEAATDLDRNALVAIAEIDGEHVQPRFAIHPIIEERTSETVAGKPLTQQRFDLASSAALGWPSDTATTNLYRMSPTLGAELPVVGRTSGFAGRFQAFGWPALAVAVPLEAKDDSLEAVYLSFSNHVTYDRGTARRMPDGSENKGVAPISFDGPTARHLLPAIARRRAPDKDITDAVLANLSRAGLADSSISRTSRKIVEKSAPILPPAIERGTVGRRPGVLEASIASVTVPGDRELFDGDHPRFGRPANSGPVAAHQLRNPRSPMLPTDEVPKDPAEMVRRTLNYRRRTYVSLADLTVSNGRLPLFDAYLGGADLVRFHTAERHDKAVFQLEGDTFLGPNWDGKLKVAVTATKLDLADTDAPRVKATGKLQIGDISFRLMFRILPKPADPIESLEFDVGSKTIDMEVERLANVRDALMHANPDTPIRFVLELHKLGSPTGRSDLPRGPRGQVFLPLMLDPGVRRVVPIETTTIIFGDPSYDRQLASQTASSLRLIGTAPAQKTFLLSADRREYDLGLPLYMAGGTINTALGTFDGSTGFTLQMRRLPQQLDNGDQPPPEQLMLAGANITPTGDHIIPAATAVEVQLQQLVRLPPEGEGSPANPVCALRPGDRLELSAKPDGATERVVIVVDIVGEPVIAPPPAVFSVIKTGQDKSLARVKLHAAAPLPQKIEFPDLLTDLALEHVRRRALFVWSYPEPGKKSPKGDIQRIDLVKFDRAGGAQLPP